MEPRNQFKLTISIKCAITVYVLRLSLNHITNGKKINKTFVKKSIEKNSEFRAAKLNEPFELDTKLGFYVLLIKRTEDDNDIFQDLPEIGLIRNNWRVLFCNRTGSDLKISTKTLEDEKFNLRNCQDFKGLISCRHVKFVSILDDEKNEDPEQD